MIITQNRHGLSPDDGDILHDYVFRDELRPPRLVGVFNIIGETPCRAMRAMEMMRDASRASIAFQHITINPKYNLSEQWRDLAVSRILDVLGAEEHGYVLVEHFKKRASPGRADHHFHLVLAHVGPHLRALDMSHSFARLEAVAKSLELDFGEDLSPTTRPQAVAYFARESGRDDVADRIIEMHDGNLHIFMPFEIGTVDRQENDWADIDIEGKNITAAAVDGLTGTALSDGGTSATSSNCQLLEAPDISADEGLHSLPGTPSWPVDPINTANCPKAETRYSGDGGEVERTEAIEPECNRDDAMPPSLNPMKITASTRAESERREDASTGIIDAPIREVSPKPTAKTARIRILQRLDDYETSLHNKLLLLRTPLDEPGNLVRARSVLAAAKTRLQYAMKMEEVARNEIAVLDAQRPASLIAKISGNAAKFAFYDEAKRRHVDATEARRFAQNHLDRSSVAVEVAEKQWKAEEREIQHQRDQKLEYLFVELRRIAQTRVILEEHPELALQPRKLAAATTRSCERLAADIDSEVSCYSPRPPV